MGWLPFYRHCWAGISGSIEKDDPSPYSAALRELREETTLTSPGSLEFIRTGKPYSFVDEDLNREWTIHPFGFRLKTEAEGGQGEKGLQIDWEHEGWQWHDPAHVSDTKEFGGVPHIADSLRRVWFEKVLGDGPGAILAEGLDRLKNDHESGARQLAGEALSILRNVVAALDRDEPAEIWWANVRIAAWHIWKNGRESMGAAIMNVLLGALRSIEETMRQHEEHPDSVHSLKWRDSVVESLERLISLRATNSAGVVSAAFLDYLQSAFSAKSGTNAPLSILTLSESSTIAQCLQLVAQKADLPIDLRILESRPLYEGVSLAGSVAQAWAALDGEQRDVAKFKITIYTDASAAIAAEGVDIVLIGADRIASSGAVSNKTGSLPAVLSAKHVSPSAKTVVLGESEKVAPPGDPREHVVEDNDPMQLVRAWEAGQNGERVRSAATGLSAAVGRGLDRHQAGGLDGVAVQIRNVFFEWVPPDLIDVYVTEFGVWRLEDIAKHSENLGAEEQRLFKDL
ncbi:uncharacterized protein E0L32_005888 [Thyridium curvatum]|uniref:Nudix hydrolase domain-containing protein n=1 Tax=Thyridium curvatum TaxID=1093900 RepID=A0A507ASB6_9PEZI|nr:uncharacterized protein E0L32_005888 [Thyridium curvatum]TPX13685.1 hypothetical protein E0L32_005888 [Thyridium curvatum]